MLFVEVEPGEAAMLDFIEALSRKYQILIAMLLVIATFGLLAVLASEIKTNQPHAHAGSRSVNYGAYSGWGDSPNMVTNGLAATAAAFEQVTNTAGDSVANGANTVGTALVASGRFVIHGPAIVLRGVGTGFLWTARTVGNSLYFVGRIVGKGLLFGLSIPVHIVGFVFDTPVVSAMIRPGGTSEVPIITSDAPSMFAPAPLAAKTASAQAAVQKVSQIVRWPIHGAVTTLFGVPEWPYEAIHTGVDISDGTWPGTTPVHAFKAGRVIATIYTPTLGLGNHVIIDHGGGLTSVYGHLNSISVKVGQVVTTSTVVGYEGTTGVSTGTHLHFEIHVHGTPVNPMNYIPGRP